MLPFTVGYYGTTPSYDGALVPCYNPASGLYEQFPTIMPPPLSVATPRASSTLQSMLPQETPLIILNGASSAHAASSQLEHPARASSAHPSLSSRVKPRSRPSKNSQNSPLSANVRAELKNPDRMKAEALQLLNEKLEREKQQLVQDNGRLTFEIASLSQRIQELQQHTQTIQKQKLPSYKESELSEQVKTLTTQLQTLTSYQKTLQEDLQKNRRQVNVAVNEKVKLESRFQKALDNSRTVNRENTMIIHDLIKKLKNAQQRIRELEAAQIG